jgi:hypothetical protein
MVDGHDESTVPPAASTVPENEAGGDRRKPGIRRVHKCQDVAFLVVFLVFCVGFIVETSFGSTFATKWWNQSAMISIRRSELLPGFSIH